jgi:hypothetical protein
MNENIFNIILCRFSLSLFFPVRIISFICAHPNGSKSEREISKRMDGEKRISLFSHFHSSHSAHDSAEKLNAASVLALLFIITRTGFMQEKF